jgi:hypothetical protein
MTSFAGLTAEDCPRACDEQGCVLSGKSYCAHPRKGGLQAGQQQDADALRRVQRARDQIDHEALAALAGKLARRIA